MSESEFAPGLWRLIALQVGDQVELRETIPGTDATGVFYWRMEKADALRIAAELREAAKHCVTFGREGD